MSVKPLKIGLDYDETFTADPMLWRAFIFMAKRSGHEIKFVTFRPSGYHNNVDIIQHSTELDVEIIYTRGDQKRHHYPADIWIDDMPITIPSADELISMHAGCVASGDV